MVMSTKEKLFVNRSSLINLGTFCLGLMEYSVNKVCFLYSHVIKTVIT